MPSPPRLPPGWEGDRKIESIEDGLKIKGQPEQTGFESGCPPPATAVVAVRDRQGTGSRRAIPVGTGRSPQGRSHFFSPLPLMELDVAVDLLFNFIYFEFKFTSFFALFILFCINISLPSKQQEESGFLTTSGQG